VGAACAGCSPQPTGTECALFFPADRRVIVSSVVEKGEEQRPRAAPPTPAKSEPLDDDNIPLTIVERRTGWRLFDLGELWRYHELLFFLALRDIKVRYKQTVIGAAWTVLQPIATTAAFTLFLGRVASKNDEAIPYPLFVFSGILPWMFFSSAVSAAASSVVGNERILTKVYFPRLLVPLSAVLASVFDFLVSFVLLLVMMPMPFFHTLPGWHFLLLPVIIAVMVVLALGLGVFLSAVNVAYRDFRVIVPLALQLWMFATPVLYIQKVFIMGQRQMINPLHGIIVNFRAAVLGQPFDWPALGVSALVGVLALLFGCFYFRRVESGFADII
jgi:lipopolysaccharide transport system permease protein